MAKRLLIANDFVGNGLDDGSRNTKDYRAWSQRLLWFARTGDIVVLPDCVDREFLHYVTSLTGTDPNSLAILTPPPGRYGARVLDDRCLYDGEFTKALRNSGVESIDDVITLWPSAATAAFIADLGLLDRYSGGDFIVQGGGELVNSKAHFRALSVGAGTSIVDGQVCRTRAGARGALASLIETYGAAMVKQSFNAAGLGNEIVVGTYAGDLTNSGGRHVYDLTDGLDDYLDQRWEWASSAGRFPVVIEAFLPNCTTVYAEHRADDDALRLGEVGALIYRDRWLAEEIVPAPDLTEALHTQLVTESGRLAELYRQMGYRGPLSVDAILTPGQELLFTEMNACYTGSTHLYERLLHSIVGNGRYIVQRQAPASWEVKDFAHFRDVAHELGVGYDPETRTGVLMPIPIIPDVSNKMFIFCVAYRDNSQVDKIFDTLNNELGARQGE